MRKQKKKAGVSVWTKIASVFRPRWRHHDPARRLKAVKRLSDPEILRRVVLDKNENSDIRIAALERLGNPGPDYGLYGRIAGCDSSDIRTAFAGMLDTVADVEALLASSQRDDEFRPLENQLSNLLERRIECETDPAVLLELAQKSISFRRHTLLGPDMGEHARLAVSKIGDPAWLFREIVRIRDADKDRGDSLFSLVAYNTLIDAKEFVSNVDDPALLRKMSMWLEGKFSDFAREKIHAHERAEFAKKLAAGKQAYGEAVAKGGIESVARLLEIDAARTRGAESPLVSYVKSGPGVYEGVLSHVTDLDILLRLSIENGNPVAPVARRLAELGKKRIEIVKETRIECPRCHGNCGCEVYQPYTDHDKEWEDCEECDGSGSIVETETTVTLADIDDGEPDR